LQLTVHSFRNEWKAKLEIAIKGHRESNDKALFELSTLYEKKNVISFDYVKKINDLIIENDIKIKELYSVLNDL